MSSTWFPRRSVRDACRTSLLFLLVGPQGIVVSRACRMKRPQDESVLLICCATTSNSLPNCILPDNPIDNLHPLHPIRISLNIALILWKTEHKVGLLGRISRPLRNMRHYTGQNPHGSNNPAKTQGIDSPPCPFGSKSVTNEVHMRAAICPSSSLAGSVPRTVIFCTGFAKTKGIYTRQSLCLSAVQSHESAIYLCKMLHPDCRTRVERRDIPPV